MLRPIIYGSGGQLGWALMKRLERDGLKPLGLDLPTHDITDRKKVYGTIDKERPNIIINTSAYTAVDQAERDEIKAFRVNRDGPSILAEACSKYGIPLIHISTDYVFDGEKDNPYFEYEPIHPIGVYGRSKSAGEEEVRQSLSSHIIIRTAWLYGIHGNNFVKTMIRLGREREELKVVDDQYGCPTFSGDLAEAIIHIMDSVNRREQIEWGTYHYCGEGRTSWYRFAHKIIEIAKKHIRLKVSQIIPIKTTEYPTLAQRPSYSVLSCEKIKRNFGIQLKPWETSLENSIQDIVRKI